MAKTRAKHHPAVRQHQQKHRVDRNSNRPRRFQNRSLIQRSNIVEQLRLSEGDLRSSPHVEIDFCDKSCPGIKSLVAQLKKSSKDDRDFAAAAFEWVRDNIKYCVLPDWTVPVEFTLQTREGQCGTKSCLLVTLLRAVGVQAAFYVIRPFDTGRKMFLLPQWIRSILSHSGVHFFVGVKLDGKWIKLDPSFDKELSLGIQNACPGRSYLATFDGYHDALIADEFYTGSGLIPVPDIDMYMRKKHRVPAVVHKCMNVCFDYIRDSWRRNVKVENLIVEMEDYLSREYSIEKATVESLC